VDGSDAQLRRRIERVRAWAWPLLASALHVGVLYLLDRLAPERVSPSKAAEVKPAELSVEVDVEHEAGTAERPPAAPKGEEGSAQSRAPEPVARYQAPPSSLEQGPAETENRALEESPSRDHEARPAPIVEAPSGEEGPALSLDALGVGEKNPFLRSDLARDRRPPRARARPSSQERLDKRLADDQLHADHVRSLGPAGPVLTHLEAATRGGEAAVNANALFHCVVDAKGRVVSVTLAESSSDPTPWRRIAKRVADALKSQVLRVPKTGHGATIAIRVTSREALPSGADPGLTVSVLGIPIQEGAGEKSARIDILDVVPKLEVEEIELDSGQVYKVPTVKLPRILSITADPSDIGSPAQRMVHARVESIEAAPRKANE
jgi:hypothetical protein